MIDSEYVRALLCVAVGGALGASLRFLVSDLFSGLEFPFGTLVVNVLGSFLLALLFFYLGSELTTGVRMLAFTGVFGAFTTMSTFSLETFMLAESGTLTLALVNVLANLGLCLGGAYGGYLLANVLP